MPSIGEYEANAVYHELYTKLGVLFYTTDALYSTVVVTDTQHRDVSVAQRLQAADAKAIEAYQLDYSAVLTMCMRGW